MKQLIVSLSVILILALTGPAVAQNVPPAPDTGATIRATATEVLLDLVVRDKHGRQVKNLKPGDVEIYEDGVKQQILSFRLASSRETQRQKTETQAVPAQAAASASPRPLRAVNPVCIVFHNLDPVSRTRAIEAVQEFIKNDLPPETYIGLFALDDRLRPVHEFTKDRNELIKATPGVFAGRTLDLARASEALLSASLNRVKIIVEGSAASTTVTQVITGGELSRQVLTGADVSTGTGASRQRGDAALQRDQFANVDGMRQTDQVITMVDQLGPLPGRKTVLLLSNGLFTTGDPNRFESILAKANQAGLTIYALDPRGLDETSTIQAGKLALDEVAKTNQTQTRAGDDLATMRQKSRAGDTMLQDAVRTSDGLSSLRSLSEGTGGFLIANTHDYRKPFQRMIEDVGAHYEAAYRSTSNKLDGSIHSIEVKLARPDYQVESRAGYFAMPALAGSTELQPFETVALAVLNIKPLPHAFDFRAAAFRFRNDGANAQGALAIDVPAANLAATPDPAHLNQRVHVSLLALVKDAGGQIVDKFSVDAPYDIPTANLPGFRASGLSFTHPLSLPPGHYTIETSVVDRQTGRASTNSVQIESPAPRKGAIGISSVLLVQRADPINGPVDPADPLVFQGARMVPLLATNLDPAAKAFVYFVVYPDPSSTEKPQIEVEFLVDGKSLAKQTADLRPPDASGAIPTILGVLLRPGNCELKITALQGSQTATESVTYAVTK